MKEIRRYEGGGLANLDDSGIPHAFLIAEVGLPDGDTQSFSMLKDAMNAFLEKTHCRLSVIELPDGEGKPFFAITVDRQDNDLTVVVETPEWEFEYEGDSGKCTIMEVYIRDAYGATFYVPSLEEGIRHLFSDEGYRLSVYEWPDGAGWGKPRYGIVVYKVGAMDFDVKLEAPGLSPDPRLNMNRIAYDTATLHDPKAPSPSVRKTRIHDNASTLEIVEIGGKDASEQEEQEEFDIWVN